MKVRVETYEGHGGVDMLRRLYFDGREIEVSSNLDQWHGADYHYVKVKDADAQLVYRAPRRRPCGLRFDHVPK